MNDSITRDEAFNKLITDPIYYDQAEVICDKLFGPANVSTNAQPGDGSDTGAPVKPGGGSH